MKIYYLGLLLLSINGMAQKNKDVSSLENEVWAIGNEAGGDNWDERNPASGEKYEFLKNGDVVRVEHMYGMSIGFMKTELKGKYTYLSEKEEVYLNYDSVPAKECIKLIISPDSARLEVWFYANWEKHGQQYFPVGKPRVYSFSAKTPIKNGYSLHTPCADGPGITLPAEMIATLVRINGRGGSNSFSRTKTPVSQPAKK